MAVNTAEKYTFSAERLVQDIEETCKAIGAKYSKSTTRAVISAFEQNFSEAAVVWRATNRPGDALNYRFYERRSVEVLRIAEDSGLLKPKHPLTLLLNSWSAPWGLADQSMVPQQFFDFDAEQGLAKAWIYMGALRPVDDVLDVDNVPDTIRQYRKAFHDLGFDGIRHIAVDFHVGTINLYSRIKGPITEPMAKKMVELAGYSGFSGEDLADIPAFLSSDAFTFAVTIKVATAEIKRVAFYALGLPPNKFPDVGDRLMTFFHKAPSYDPEDFTAVAWSFGKGKEKYIKGEKSYCGDVVQLLRDWKSSGFHR